MLLRLLFYFVHILQMFTLHCYPLLRPSDFKLNRRTIAMDWETLVGYSSRTCKKRSVIISKSLLRTYSTHLLKLSIPKTIYPKGQGRRPVFCDRLRTIHIPPKWMRRVMWLLVCVLTRSMRQNSANTTTTKGRDVES